VSEVKKKWVLLTENPKSYCGTANSGQMRCLGWIFLSSAPPAICEDKFKCEKIPKQFF